MKKSNLIELEDNMIIHNKNYGIDLMGMETKIVLKNNKILFNEVGGIKVGISVSLFLIRNEISHNKIGVNLISC